MSDTLAEYTTYMFDSRRWQQIVLRPDDIIISTPPKCGTTWTQMICALLVLQTPELPAPLGALSPFIDVQTRPLAEVLTQLDAQRHRRFMKSHTPLDGLPYDERVSYVVVGRDPRDVAISRLNHYRNVDADLQRARREAAVGPTSPDEPSDPEGRYDGSPKDQFWQWMTEQEDPFHGLRSTLHHLSSFWAARERANIVLLHYDDLKRDLAGQMRALAARLGIEVPDGRWAELVTAATFEQMRARADTLAPGFGMFRDSSQFFQRGTSGQWRELLDDADRQRYATMVSDLAEPDLVQWLHREPL